MDSDKMQDRLGQQASPPYGIIPMGCNFTPDEVGRMLANRVVQPHYAAWLVHKVLQCHGARVDELQAECNEQARLNGMGAEREARMMAQVAELRAERDALAKDAARYRWLRERWGRVAEEYEDDRMTFIGREKNDGEGWYTDPDSVDAAIDAAMAEGER